VAAVSSLGPTGFATAARGEQPHAVSVEANCGCASGAASTSPCTADRPRHRQVRGNGGAWTSCMTRCGRAPVPRADRGRSVESRAPVAGGGDGDVRADGGCGARPYPVESGVRARGLGVSARRRGLDVGVWRLSPAPREVRVARTRSGSGGSQRWPPRSSVLADALLLTLVGLVDQRPKSCTIDTPPPTTYTPQPSVRYSPIMFS
jgi:hypothetical protein